MPRLRTPYILSACILAACGSAPSGDSDGSTSGSSSESSSTLAPTTETTASVTTSGESSTGPVHTSTSTSTSTSESSTGADSSSSTDTSSDESSSSTGVEECPGGPMDEWYGVIPPELVTDEPYDHDAGLAALVALAPPRNGVADLSADPAVITGAIVAIVGYPIIEEFWIADANAHVHVRLVFSEGIAGVEPGAEIDLEVTQLTDDNGSLQVTAVASSSVTATDHPVWVQDANEVAPDYASHPDEVFTIWGTLTENLGECGGGFTCYTLSYCSGEVGVRIAAIPDIAEGDVVQIVGPLYDLPGDMRFNTRNWSWLRELP